MNDLVVLSTDAARRVAAAVKAVERMPRATAPGASMPRIVQPNKCGITTTALSPRSGKTPGSGMVQPYTFDGTQFVIDGDPIKVRNWTGSTIPDDVWIEYHIIDGYLFFNGNDCSGVAP